MTLDLPIVPSWRDRADCRHWRGFDDLPHDERKPICVVCPVRPECLADDPDPTFGAKDINDKEVRRAWARANGRRHSPQALTKGREK